MLTSAPQADYTLHDTFIRIPSFRYIANVMNARIVANDAQLRPRQDALTAREAAALLDLSERTVRRAIQRRELSATKWGGVFRIDPGELDRFRDARLSGMLHEAHPLPKSIPRRALAAFHVPTPLTCLIGREREVEALLALLRAPEGPRLVVITGPGGVGKTRLTLAIAEQARATYLDGVAFISLAAIRDHVLVPGAIARALGIRELGERSLTEHLVAELAGKRVLLILDNFEQVAAAAPWVSELLASCPGLAVLVTSRSRLRLMGERTFPLLPLAVEATYGHGDDAAEGHHHLSPAVQLFIARASAVAPGEWSVEEHLAEVTDICRRLDGLPLAIELAAARTPALSPAALLARLDPRLPLLSDGPLDLPFRQQTMWRAIAWSYDLLTPAEQQLFRCLSVLAGGFTLDSAEAIATVSASGSPGQTLRLITSLADKSLLHRTEGHDSEPRLAMLETVREFGWERLSELRELGHVRQRHAEYFLTLAEESERKLRSHELIGALARLEAEHDNLRAALAWSLDDPSRVDAALRLTGALHWFWYLRDHYGEGRQWLEAAVEHSVAEPPSPQRAKALASAGLLAIHPSRDYEAARTCFEQSVSVARALGEPASLAYALHFLAWAELVQRDPGQIRSTLEESIALFRQAGDQWGVAAALCTLGMASIIEHDAVAASTALQESLSLSRDVGDPWCIARSLHYAGEVARFRGATDEARQLYEESITLYRMLDHRGSVAIVTHNLGYVSLHHRDPQRALACFVEALTVHLAQRDQPNIGHGLRGLAGAATLLRHPEQAARLFGAADAQFARIGVTIWPVDKVDSDRHLETARTALGEATFDAAYAAGQEMALEVAIADAMAMTKWEGATTESGDGAHDEPERPLSLTPRERHVLRLVAQHATDREIAEQLSISPRTVMHHVSNVLAKLGVTNRRDAAVMAVQIGLD